MRRQMMAAMMGMMMTMAGTGLAMADTPQDNTEAAGLTSASVCYTLVEPGQPEVGSEMAQITITSHDSENAWAAVRADGAYDVKEGLHLFRMSNIEEGEDGAKTAKVVGGAIDREGFGEILSALGLSEKEQQERLAAYDEYETLQVQINELYKSIDEDADTAEQAQLFEEAGRLRDQQVSPFSGDVLDKALELGMIEESEVTFCEAESVTSGLEFDTADLDRE